MKPTLLFIILLAFFLRTYQLDQQALRGDEAATVLYSAMPINQLWELSRVTDPHPPLYYLLLHPWQWLLGEEAWTMRFVGVIASTLSVAALYGLARRALPHEVSLLAAFLLAINPLQIWLAQDVRSYSLFTLLGLLSAMALWTWLIPNPKSQIPNPKSLFLYIFLTVACLYLHYYTVFLIAFQGLFVLLNFRQFLNKRWVGSQIAIGLLIIPGLTLAYNFMGQAAGGIEKIPTLDIFRLAFTALLTGFTLDPTWGAWLTLFMTPIWLIGLIMLLRHNVTTGTFWGLFFAIPMLGVIAMSIDRPFFKERFLVQAQPAFELLLAVGLVGFWTLDFRFWINPPIQNLKSKIQNPTNPKSLAAYCLFCTIFLLYTNGLALQNYFTNPAYAKSKPWHLYQKYVHQNDHSGDVMVTNFPEASVSYYSPNELPFYVVPEERDHSVEYRLSRIEQIANGYQRLWFIPLLHQGFDETGDVLHWLDRHADRVNQVFFPDYNLNLYLTPPTIDKLMIKQPTRFVNGINLLGYQIFDKNGQPQLSPESLFLTRQAGQSFTLSLYWQADGPTDVPYTVFVHLLAVDGFNRVGRDNQPVWGSYPTTAWQVGERISDKYSLTIPQGSPVGDHRLQIGFYESETAARVPVVEETGQSSRDHVMLKVIIRIEP